MSSDLQVPFQTRKPGARRYTNFIVRNHYNILAPGRETVRETSKSCVSRSNRESWEACTTALGLLKKEEEEEEECQIAIFNFARHIRNIALYSDLIHSFDWKSAVEHDGGV